jgi:hypothetical protein
MPVSFSDLQLAFEFVSSGGMGENEAYLDRQSGKIYWHSEFGDNDEELPDDIDNEKYIAIPDKRELDLGKPLVLDFARSGGEPNSAESQRRGSLVPVVNIVQADCPTDRVAAVQFFGARE